MPDETAEWTVPVVTRIGTQRRALKVAVLDGDVVMETPPGAQVVIPVTSDNVLCDAIREARRVASQMGQGL